MTDSEIGELTEAIYVATGDERYRKNVDLEAVAASIWVSEEQLG
jgi:hypothetical protein